jgi:putative membrane protein
MIIRPEQHWFFRLFDWHGSVLSKITTRLLLNVIMSVIAIVIYQWYQLPSGIHLTVAPFSLLGIAIAIFLAFVTMPATAALLRRAICGACC